MVSHTGTDLRMSCTGCGIVGQAVHFAMEVGNRGKPLDEDRSVIRLEICRENKCGKHIDGDRTERRCADCGCYLDMTPIRMPIIGRAGRARWTGFDCPLKLWPKLD